MHPAIIEWWKSAREGRCASHRAYAGGGSCGSSSSSEGKFAAGDDGGGGFGVRRPLRFLAFKLQLDETQMEGLARILNELKTERAQAAVDDRRTVTALADAIAGESFDEKRAEEGAALRLGSAERLKGAVVSALRQIHALLRSDQRARLAYLIRTGTLSL